MFVLDLTHRKHKNGFRIHHTPTPPKQEYPTETLDEKPALQARIELVGKLNFAGKDL